MMKKIFGSIIVVALLFVSNSCDSLDEISQFSFDLENTITIVPTNIVGDFLEITSETTPTHIAATLNNYNTQENFVEQIYLKNCTLEIDSPIDGIFSFLEDINIYIQVDGLPNKKIAWSEAIPNTQRFELITTTDDIKAYLLSANYSLYIDAQNDEIIAALYEVTIQNDYEVNARLIGN